MFIIQNQAQKAIDLLSDNGFEAYLVGGCVRDSILGREFNDYDITTSALPEEIKKVFSDFRVIETGIKHGTVTVLIDELPLEITTYRIDGDYIDNRHPENVTFSRNIADDLSRRDFTVNAMAYNGKLVDLYGGMDDLQKKIIRCVGDPHKRFNEDGLRILRALRFASVLGFQIEKQTADAIIKNMSLLNNISSERICIELKKLLCGKNASEIIRDFGTVFDSYFDTVGFCKTSEFIDNCVSELVPRMSLFFLHDVNYKNDLKKLKLDNNNFNSICRTFECSKIDLRPCKTDIKRFMRDYGQKVLEDVCKLWFAQGRNVDLIENIVQEIVAGNECYTIRALDITGNEIQALGIEKRQIGQTLDKLLDLVIDEKLQNTNDKLIGYIKENLI